jgi:sugar O-acyltransferase (sialic acid O-acetyltransferase NeuD family)
MVEPIKQKLVIVGDGETAELAYEYFTYDSDYEVVAFTAEKAYIKKDLLFGLPVVPFEDVASLYNPQTYHMFIAVSFTQLNRIRRRLYQQAKIKGYKLASYVSSKAFVWRNVVIGENCFILENNVLQYNVKIGDNVTLWSGNHLGHRSVIHDNCFVSSQVTISGYCSVGANCFLGVNSCVADNVKVAEDCLIGAGAVVLHDTFAGLVYVGNPAKPLPNKTSLQAFHLAEEVPEAELLEQKVVSNAIAEKSFTDK